MKKIILFAVSLCGMAVYSQKPIVAISAFEASGSSSYYDGSYAKKDVSKIEDVVYDAFANTKRFILVERQKMQNINNERRLQQGEDYIDGYTIEQSKSLGASYLVVGNVTQATVEQQQTNLGRFSVPSRKAKIDFSMRVINVETGEIVGTANFQAEKRGKNAMNDALEEIKPNIDEFISKNFKSIFTLVQVEEKDSNNNAQEVLISGVFSTDVKNGAVLRVFEETKIPVNGKMISRKKDVGKIKITKIEDENFAICTVLSGADEITKKIESKTSLNCELE